MTVMVYRERVPVLVPVNEIREMILRIAVAVMIYRNGLLGYLQCCVVLWAYTRIVVVLRATTGLSYNVYYFHSKDYLCKRVTPQSALFAPSTRGVLMPTLRQAHVIASHMGASSVDRVLLLPMRRVKERRRLG